MIFTVSGRSALGLALIACETITHALDHAAEMVGRGYVDVLIADGRGAQFTPDQFTRFYCL